MAKLQKLAHYAGILILLVWGGVLIYFYLSGRIIHYLTSNATFREQALIAGLVLVVLALFNLLTGNAEVGAHEHGHSHDDDEGHDAHDGHHHSHAHAGEGHGHGQGHVHAREHEHEHEHEHSHGHEDDHGHEHEHTCGCGHGEHAHHGHDHESTFVGGPVAALVLLVPILLSAFLTPDAYSARAVRNKLALTTYGAEAPRGIPTLGSKIAAGSSTGGAVAEDGGAAAGEGGAPQSATPSYGEFTQADLDRMVDKSPEGNYMLEIIELFYTAGDTEIQRVLEGLPMEAVGQVLADTGKRDPGASERLRIFRLYVECCAADARPLSIPVEFSGGLPEFREMGWYKVTGAVTYRQENGVTVPVIEGQTLTQVEPPEERMSF